MTQLKRNRTVTSMSILHLLASVSLCYGMTEEDNKETTPTPSSPNPANSGLQITARSAFAPPSPPKTPPTPLNSPPTYPPLPIPGPATSMKKTKLKKGPTVATAMSPDSKEILDRKVENAGRRIIKFNPITPEEAKMADEITAAHYRSRSNSTSIIDSGTNPSSSPSPELTSSRTASPFAGPLPYLNSPPAGGRAISSPAIPVYSYSRSNSPALSVSNSPMGRSNSFNLACPSTHNFAGLDFLPMSARGLGAGLGFGAGARRARSAVSPIFPIVSPPSPQQYPLSTLDESKTMAKSPFSLPQAPQLSRRRHSDPSGSGLLLERAIIFEEEDDNEIKGFTTLATLAETEEESAKNLKTSTARTQSVPPVITQEEKRELHVAEAYIALKETRAPFVNTYISTNAKWKALVADDLLPLLKSRGFLLKKSGFKSLYASDGLESFVLYELLANLTPPNARVVDVIITDENMDSSGEKSCITTNPLIADHGNSNDEDKKRVRYLNGSEAIAKIVTHSWIHQHPLPLIYVASAGNSPSSLVKTFAWAIMGQALKQKLLSQLALPPSTSTQQRGADCGENNGTQIFNLSQLNLAAMNLEQEGRLENPFDQLKHLLESGSDQLEAFLLKHFNININDGKVISPAKFKDMPAELAKLDGSTRASSGAATPASSSHSASTPTSPNTESAPTP